MNEIFDNLFERYPSLNICKDDILNAYKVAVSKVFEAVKILEGVA